MIIFAKSVITFLRHILAVINSLETMNLMQVPIQIAFEVFLYKLKAYFMSIFQSFYRTSPNNIGTSAKKCMIRCYECQQKKM